MGPCYLSLTMRLMKFWREYPTITIKWPSTRQAAARGTSGVHNVDALTTLSAQVTSLTRMVKAMTTAPATVNQISDVSCVYCGEGYLFNNCSRNLASVNYVATSTKRTRTIYTQILTTLDGDIT